MNQATIPEFEVIYDGRGSERASSILDRALFATAAVAVPRETMALIDGECRRIGVPSVLGSYIVAGESEFDLYAMGDGGMSHGGIQVHLPAHNHGRDHWTGLEGLRRSFALMGDRWAYAWSRSSRAWLDADPVAFVADFWPRAQGCVPAFAAREAPRAVASGGAAWNQYLTGGGPNVDIADLFYDPATGLTLPATPPVTGFWNPPGHYGVDVGGGGIGSPIRNVVDGTVVYAGWLNNQSQPVRDGSGFGLTVLVASHDGYVRLYGHNSELMVTIGDTVKRGQLIARMGNTGYVIGIGGGDGSHLHYAKYPGRDVTAIYNANAVDPTPDLQLGAARWTGRTTDGVRLRSRPDGTTDEHGNDTTLAILPAGTPLFVPDGDDVRVPVVAAGVRGWVSVPYIELDGTGGPGPTPPPTPPPGPTTGIYLSIADMRVVRDGLRETYDVLARGQGQNQEAMNRILYVMADWDRKLKEGGDS